MVERLVIIDCGSGNLRSVQKAIERAALDNGVSLETTISSDPDAVATADRLVLPGVGAFRACIAGLRAIDGLIPAMEETVLAAARPTLGICVGMQMLADHGFEFGSTPGLGWIPGQVRPLDVVPGRRIPHMGWNTVRVDQRHQALHALPLEDDYYFAHSFHFDVKNEPDALGFSDYHGAIVALIGRDNILGAQCHPEKSQMAGRRLLTEFLKWSP